MWTIDFTKPTYIPNTILLISLFKKKKKEGKKAKGKKRTDKQLWLL